MWIGPVNLLLVGYFGSLFAGLYWIIKRSWSHAGASTTQRALFILLGLLSLTLAWYNIVAFIIEDYAERHSPDVSKRPTENRFVRAYRQVVETPLQWFWSSSLLSFVPSMIGFSVLEAHRNGIFDTAVYIWVGFFGAISGSFPMFLLRLIQKPRTNAAVIVSKTPQLNLSTAFFCIVGLFSVAWTPSTLNNQVEFIQNLAFMHFILLLPLLNRSKSDGIWHSSSWAVFFSIMSFLALLVRVSTIDAVFREITLSLPGILTLIRAIGSNWCQLSISGDEIFCTILTVIYLLDDQHKEYLRGSKRIRYLGCLLFCLPLLSASVVFPAFLCLRELRMSAQTLKSVKTKVL
eukprot:TRINITY_DN3546_c0_g1_i1.p1 TRINITY_DN3546_c0_g1~~TRINITY_DN3546_c0_g1_i1.p1  ORF type:complete len:347 (-),score=46.06 TRINITY_DN3546_c0_g1_i1:152-1192(-)